MPQHALKVIRPIVRAFSTLSPRFSGRLAFRLFCTPIRHAKVNDRHPTISRAKNIFVDAEARKVAFCSGYVMSFHFRPKGEARGAVLLLHGWAGQALFMAGFVPPLIEAGFRVIAIDLPAHGGSSGNKLNFPLAIDALGAVLRDADMPDAMPVSGIIGHSFGGAVAAAAIAGGVPLFPALRAQRLVTIAAPEGMRDYGRMFASSIGLTMRGHAAFEDRVLAITGRHMESFSGAAYLRQTQIPTLVVHSTDDREIPFRDAEALAGASPNSRLMAVSGLGHRRILFAEPVHQAAAAFLGGA